MNQGTLQQLIRYRQELHQYPEISGKEKATANRILNWLKQYEPDAIITDLGGYGLAAAFHGKADGSVIVFRAELDALPIKESNTFMYRSQKPKTAHLCGHDGHMAFLIGLADSLKANPPAKGKVVLLFQPAEETGRGAEKVISNRKFTTIQPDYVFAIHNLPGFPLHEVILSKRNFAAASTGMIIKLHGKTSHAAEPEKGLSPVRVVADLIQELEALPQNISGLKSFALLTIIHVNIGEVAFGTTPGEAVVMATLRAFEDEDLRKLSQQAEKVVTRIVSSEKLEQEISYTESFPATINHPDAANIVFKAVKNLGLGSNEITEPFKWTEDFGHFTKTFKAALIGLGSGENHPALHNPDYDFPDELIPTGVSIFRQICRELGL